ncbi:asparagine synthase (glutamine-hydrolyzing) [candidate division KSB1 bacterium]|nr:asparagine synthase (glutamine-hydrolyzing) [candidate division KSB1 bacterium]
MCGIAGIFDCVKLNPDILPSFKKCVNILDHRGPDGKGIYFDEFTALGQARLSIFDLEGGQQPIPNEDGSLWLVCNGEIFNYIELRKELENKGHVFSTHTDVEVILHLYEDYGENLLKYLNGQFAFAVWDRKKHSLFLARDHIGICPLYYSKIKDQFAFASEAKALFFLPGVTPEINLQALIQTFTFWAPLPGESMFKNIFELKPGYFMWVNEKKSYTRQYWKCEYPSDETGYITDPVQAVDEVSFLLEDAVRLRLRADVPVGAYLSGGLDSSITTSLVKLKNNNKLRTFSIGFEDVNFDETYYQQLVSKNLNTDHSAFRCSNESIGNVLEQVVWHTEKPILRTAPAPLFQLSKFVKENGFKVVLTGEGADEFFSGYNIYKETKIRCFNARQPDSALRPMLFSRIYPYIATNSRTLKFWQSFFQKDLLKTDDPFYSHRLRWGNKSYLSGFLRNDLLQHVSDYDPVDDLQDRLAGYIDPYDPLTRAHFLEAHIFLASYLLSSQGDRMIMSHGVEGRYPFLDKRVIEFANRLHPNFKLRILNEKWLLKKAFAGLLPDEVIKRNKQPYRAPVKASFMSNKNLIDNWFSEQKLNETGLFDVEKVNLLQKKIFQPDTVVSSRDEMAVTAILTTEMLTDQYIFNKQLSWLPTDKYIKVLDYRTEKAMV